MENQMDINGQNQPSVVRDHYLAWASGSNPKDFTASEKVLSNAYGDGFEISAPKGTMAVTLYVEVVAANDSTLIELQFKDSPDGLIWAPSQIRTNEVIAPPIVSYDMMDTTYNIVSPSSGDVKPFTWLLTMSEFIKLSIKGDGANPATVKARYVLEVR